MYFRSAGSLSCVLSRIAAPAGILSLLALLASPRASAQGAPLPDLPVVKLERMIAAAGQPPTQPVTRLASRAELDGPRTLSLAISRPTSVRAVLQLLFRGTPFSTVAHSSIRGSFVGELRNLTLRQALEAVLFPSGLDYDVSGTVIRVFPRRPATRLFTIDLLTGRRSWEARSGPSGGAVVSSGVSDTLTEIDAGVRTLLSSEGRHHVDRRAGVVHVTDFADRLDQVAVYLETVQLRATRQVRIDVRLLRVLLKGGVSAIGGLPAIVDDLERFLAALRDAGTVEVIGSPRLLAMNNEPAIIHVASDDGGESSVMVTPQISADGFIQLSVAPRLFARPAGTPGSPRAGSLIAADSVLRIREAETVVISGLPYAADQQQGAGILVLLTPSVVVPDGIRQAGQR